MKYTAVIIDDEAKGRQALREKLRTYCPEIELLAEAASGGEGIRVIEKNHPHIVFLDIEMPGMTGFDMLNRLAVRDHHIVFTTAYDQYAIKAIRYAAFDYLLKPVHIEELKECIGKITQSPPKSLIEQIDILHQNRPGNRKHFQKLAIPTLEGLVFYELGDIVWLIADSNYTLFCFKDRTRMLASKTLKNFEELLPSNTFFRPHHSCIINLNHIKRYIKGDGGQIEMMDGTYMDVSRRKRDEFLQLIK